MKITLLGDPQIIMHNPNSPHNYFAWPTAAKLQNGKIAVVASGFRLRHVCPFGKTVISYSDDDGKTYSPPIPVIDTVLDDRDGGILPFGKSNVIVTSFNNTVAFQNNESSCIIFTGYTFRCSLFFKILQYLLLCSPQGALRAQAAYKRHHQMQQSHIDSAVRDNHQCR